MVTLLALTMGVFLVTLNVTVVTVTLPDVQRSLHAAPDELEWVIDAYNLVGASLLLSAGYLADRFGRKRALCTGYAVFSSGALLCAVAPSAGWLIGFRILQAAGGTALTPTSLSIVANIYPDPRERARAIGIWGIASGLGPGSGADRRRGDDRLGGLAGRIRRQRCRGARRARRGGAGRPAVEKRGGPAPRPARTGARGGAARQPHLCADRGAAVRLRLGPDRGGARGRRTPRHRVRSGRDPRRPAAARPARLPRPPVQRRHLHHRGRRSSPSRDSSTSPPSTCSRCAATGRWRPA